MSGGRVGDPAAVAARRLKSESKHWNVFIQVLTTLSQCAILDTRRHVLDLFRMPSSAANAMKYAS